MLATQPLIKQGSGVAAPFVMSAPVFDAIIAAGLTGFDLMPEMGTGAIWDEPDRS